MRRTAKMMCGAAAFAFASFSSVAVSEPAGTANPANWPRALNPIKKDTTVERRIAGLLRAMSLEQKVGQIIQADVGSVTPEDVATYQLGSILNGGNSAPGGRAYAPAPDWLAAADAFYDASVRPVGKLPVIPMMWGSDAVHGHNNVIGATLFPHNIGLGAMRNPEMMRKIGAITAVEMRVTGLDWTFAPTLAVVRDDRWGRTYESFSENPAVVASYAGPLVEGLQGKIGQPDWLKGRHIVATAKHFVGDGGTTNGKDQGETAVSEAELRDVHAAGYKPAMQAGVQSIMASYNSWQGVKMHGNRSMLTGVLKDRMGFNGFVVGDWNGHGQIPGCKATDCAASVNAGLDMYMAPDSWKELYGNTLAQVKDGRISMERLDDAVARILRVKIRMGLFEAGRPSKRLLAGDYTQLGSPAHRAVARQAVRESLVLLKNEGATLPLKRGANVLVTGDGADSFMKQSGGWTLTWQGTALKREDFPGATTIGQGLSQAARDAGGEAVISPDGNYTRKPDVAIVVFGEDPYAEFQGDVPDLMYRTSHDHLALLERYRKQGIKTVSVFLSGRPMWVNPYINRSDAFVAAWLPGSEGAGVADVLFGKADFKGRLPFSWPAKATQYRLNVGDADYAPLFAFGYGLSYAAPKAVGVLSEDSGLPAGAEQPAGTWFARGKAGSGLKMLIMGVPVTAGPVDSVDGKLRSMPVDRNAQEDSRRFVWTGIGAVSITSATPLDIAREANGALSVEIDVRADAVGAREVYLTVDGVKGVDIGAPLRASKEWQTISVPLSCFAKRGVDMSKVVMPFSLLTGAGTDLRISRIALGSTGAGAVACAP